MLAASDVSHFAPCFRVDGTPHRWAPFLYIHFFLSHYLLPCSRPKALSSPITVQIPCNNPRRGLLVRGFCMVVGQRPRATSQPRRRQRGPSL